MTDTQIFSNKLPQKFTPALDKQSNGNLYVLIRLQTFVIIKHIVKYKYLNLTNFNANDMF